MKLRGAGRDALHIKFLPILLHALSKKMTNETISGSSDFCAGHRGSAPTPEFSDLRVQSRIERPAFGASDELEIINHSRTKNRRPGNNSLA